MNLVFTQEWTASRRLSFVCRCMGGMLALILTLVLCGGCQAVSVRDVSPSEAIDYAKNAGILTRQNAIDYLSSKYSFSSINERDAKWTFELGNTRTHCTVEWGAVHEVYVKTDCFGVPSVFLANPTGQDMQLESKLFRKPDVSSTLGALKVLCRNWGGNIAKEDQEALERKVNSHDNETQPALAAPQESSTSQLQHLKYLYDKGLISREEYDQAKAKILSEITGGR